MRTTKQETLKEVARHLMLYGSFTRNLGLLNGKMGIAIFFYEYAAYTGNNLYEEFAGELIGEIYEEITNDLPIDLGNGLCGIAWGIGYLVQRGWVEADEDEVLEELDQRIVEKDVRKMKDYSLETGLKGIGYYVLSRYNHRKGEHPLIDYPYIKGLTDSLTQEKQGDEEQDKLVESLNNLLCTEERATELPLLDSLIDKVKYRNANLFKKSRKESILESGYTGIGLKLIKKLQHEKENILA